MQKKILSFVSALLVLATLSCTKKQDAAPEVNLAIWNNYITDEQLAEFTKETGIKVNVTTYASNEELLAKVQSGASGVDVAVPSGYMIGIMRKMELLSPLDTSKLPNSKGLNEFVLKQDYDEKNEFSMPYAWTTTGIAINTELFKGKIESWKDFFENTEIAGKVSMLDDVREVMAAALKLHGQSLNTVNKGEIDKATEDLLAMKKKVKMFQSETIDPLLNNEVAVAQAFSSDALQAASKSNGKIKFILPAEGGSLAIDNLVMLKNSKNTEAAHKLINYMLSPAVNVAFVKAIMGGPVLKSTQAALPPEVAKNNALFPSPAQLAKFEKINDLGPDMKIYEAAWTKIKTN